MSRKHQSCSAERSRENAAEHLINRRSPSLRISSLPGQQSHQRALDQRAASGRFGASANAMRRSDVGSIGSGSDRSW